jgi:hypothetical protein
MTRASLSAAFLLTTILAGCGPTRPNLPPPPPHGGTAFPLPGGKGFVEVLRQDASSQAGLTQLVIYFLDADCKPLRTGATSVSFKPRGGRGAATVALLPTGNADSPNAGGLASPPFPDPGEIVGVLSAKIESKPVSVDINIR